MLRRFSPRQISKIELLKKQKMTKENIRRFCFIFLCFCHWNLSQTCLYEAERRERVRPELTASPAERKPGGCTLLVCVCVFACMSACVSVLTGKLVNTFLGTKLCQPVLLGNVQMTRGLAGKEKRADESIWTHEWKSRLYVRDCRCVQSCPEATEETFTHISWQVEQPGVFSVNVCDSLGHVGPSAGKLQTHGKATNRNIVAKYKSSQSPGVTTRAELWKWYNTVY